MATKMIRPVFIGGCDRSGTTMIASMIGGHSQVNCLPEAHFIHELCSSEQKIPELVEKILHHNRFKLWKLELSDANIKTLKNCVGFPQLIDQMAEFYGQKHGKANAPIWVEHAPRNISAVQRLSDQFPLAKFIHVIRDGRAVASSWLKQDWGPRHILTVADNWLARIGQGLAAEDKLGDKVLRLHYEEVVQDPKAAMQKVIDFLGIEFENEMLSASGFALPKHSAKTHELLDKQSTGVSKNRLQAWEQELTPRQIELFESKACDMLPLLGYELQNHSPKMPTRKENTQMLMGELLGRFLNISRRKRRHNV